MEAAVAFRKPVALSTDTLLYPGRLQYSLTLPENLKPRIKNAFIYIYISAHTHTIY